MRFRRKQRAPLLRVGFRKLPSLDKQADKSSAVGSDTRAFQALRRGTTPDEAIEIAEKVTAKIPSERLEDHKASGVLRLKRRLVRRPMIALAAALLLLLGMAAVLVSPHAGLLAFGLAANQHVATPTKQWSSVPHSGVIEITTPTNTPTAVPTQTPPPPTATPLPPTPTPPPAPQPTPPPGPYSSWTPPPGYASFAVQDTPNDPWAGSFGQCTWWAHYKRPDEDLSGMGDAWNWANAARARGLTVTAAPAPNSTVVFAPGVEGASSLGHVSHVEKVLTGGWVLVSEMNFYWNGGGFARVDYRYVYAGTGVWFIL